MPCTATILPSPDPRWRRPAGPQPPGGPSASTQDSRGPQLAQEFVWEWNLRSPGSVYSPHAGGALGEGGHRGVFPVERRALHDRIARAALRAGDERVQVAAVPRVQELPGAFRAQGQIGREWAGTRTDPPRSPRCETASPARVARPRSRSVRVTRAPPAGWKGEAPRNGSTRSPPPAAPPPPGTSGSGRTRPARGRRPAGRLRAGTRRPGSCRGRQNAFSPPPRTYTARVRLTTPGRWCRVGAWQR